MWCVIEETSNKGLYHSYKQDIWHFWGLWVHYPSLAGRWLGRFLPKCQANVFVGPFSTWKQFSWYRQGAFRFGEKPWAKSRVVNYWQRPSLFRISVIFRRGYLSSIFLPLTSLYSLYYNSPFSFSSRCVHFLWDNPDWGRPKGFARSNYTFY